MSGDGKTKEEKELEEKLESEELKKMAMKPREGGGSSSIKCPMLNSSNYTVWAMKMKILLRVHKAWEAVMKKMSDDDKNDLAMALIFQSIPETLLLQIGNLDTAKELWDAIKERHLGSERVREARLQTLINEFDQLKMKESDRIDDFVGKIASISSKAAELGEELDDAKRIKKFLSCLPRKKYILLDRSRAKGSRDSVVRQSR